MAYQLNAFSFETLKKIHVPQFDDMNELLSSYNHLFEVFSEMDSFPWILAENNFKTIDLTKLDKETRISDADYDKFMLEYKLLWSLYEKALPERVEGLCFTNLIKTLDVNSLMVETKTRNALTILNCLSLINQVQPLAEFFHQEIKSQKNYQYYLEVGSRIAGLKWRSIGIHLFSIVRAIWSSKSSLSPNFKELHSALPRQLNKTENYGVGIARYAYGKLEQLRDVVPIVSPIPKLDIVDDNCLFHLERDLMGCVLGIATTSFCYQELLESKLVFLAFSGTDLHLKNHICTDIHQLFGHADCTYIAAIGVLNEVCETYTTNEVCVIGHSLGGGLAQYSFGHLKKKYSNLKGIGYNSAGLSTFNYNQVKKFVNNQDFVHVVIDNDWCHKAGKHIGTSKLLPHRHQWFKSHRLKFFDEIIGKEYFCKL